MEAGFCLMSKGNLVVSVEPRACVGPRREQRLVSASLAPRASEHSLFHLPYHGGGQVARNRVPITPCIGYETQRLHWKYTWLLSRVKLKRNKRYGVMSVFTSQIDSPDTWPQKTRWIIFQNMGGLGSGEGCFRVFVSSAVFVLAIRGDKVLSSQLLSLFCATPWLADWIWLKHFHNH